MVKSSMLVVLMAAVISGAGAWAQPIVETPPPMVPVPPPPPMPAADPNASVQPGTPPPPSTPGPSYVPGAQPSQPGYQYSPYGQPQSKEKPGPEIGLMVSESLFGMLTAAGITVLPYFLLFGGNGALSGDSTLSSIIFILIFSAAPLAVAQTEVGLANGSRYWFSETWPAAIAGLVGEAGVLGLFYATGWLPTPQASGGVPNGGSLPLLLIGAIGVVPLIQMGVINLFKQPKFKPYVMNDEGPKRKPGEGITLAAPSASPIFMAADGSAATGINLSLLRGTW